MEGARLVIMRRVGGVVLAVTLAVVPLRADEHLDHLRMMVHAMSDHGPVIPQPLTIGPNAETVDIAAHATPSFGFTPNSFSVNQGDTVTIRLSVAMNDGSSANNPAHSLLMETYVPQPLECNKGQTAILTFVATTAGTFGFVCFQPNCGAGHSSMTGQMIVNAAPSGPSINSITPNSGSTVGGTAITIDGTGFQNGAAVTIGGIAARNVVVDSSTTITATTPIGPATEEAGLPMDVIVTNPDGTSATDKGAFTYFVPPLSVSSITPNAGLPRGGTVVVITGAGFTTAVASSVTFGDVAATNVQVLDAVTMQATAPAHAVGIVDIVVTVGGTSVTKAASFTYPPPRHRAARD